MSSSSRQVIFINNNNNNIGDDLQRELWKACAGKSYYIPKQRDQVVYFPQAHVEEIRAFGNQEDLISVAFMSTLPRAIRCSVLNVDLMAEAETDEVFAGLSLVPRQLEGAVTTRAGDRNISSMERRSRIRIYCKTLTASDVSIHGGYTIPKRHAEECFPPLDMTMNPPMQFVNMYDLHGKEWPFRHILRGKPRRHMLSTGWSAFSIEKQLIEGDTLVFLRGDNGELRIGVHRSVRSPGRASALSPIISSQGMQFGILTCAAHAVYSKSMFSVVCRPWRNRSCFIIPLGKYLISMDNDYPIGARFKMLFENDECVEQRFSGTIVGEEDFDPVRWPGSKWKCLKVRWKAPPGMNYLSERVSPWEIELDPPEKRKQVPVGFEERNLPFRPDLGFPWSSSTACTGILCSTFLGPQVTHGNLPGIVKSSELKPIGAPNVAYQGSSSSSQRFPQTPQVRPSPPRNDGNRPKFENPHGFKSFTLFGKNIVGTPSEELTSLSNTDHRTPSPSAHPSSSDTESSVRGCRVQVIMYDTTQLVSKFIDLSVISGYKDLILEIDAMFGFSVSLIKGTSRWRMMYVDADGYNVPVGDYPWREFLSVVKRIDICAKDRVHVIA